MKSTDKLSKEQVLAIPTLINKQKLSINAVAKLYGISPQGIYYHISRLRAEGKVINTRPQGQVSEVYKNKI